MRISDWSSDVCSSDLPVGFHQMDLAAAKQGEDKAGKAGPCADIQDDEPVASLSGRQKAAKLGGIEKMAAPEVSHAGGTDQVYGAVPLRQAGGIEVGLGQGWCRERGGKDG